jgi:hypothetical protein
LNRRTRPSLSGGLALAALTVLVCLLLGEAVSRIRDPEASLWRYPNYIWQATELDAEAPLQLRYDSELGYEPWPGASGILESKTLSYSADGFRNHNLDRPTATGPLILALGDSYTEGYAVSDDETWPAHLERDTGRRVLNAGVRSYGLDQIVLRAERLAPRVKPHTMVLAFIESDIGRTALSARESRFKPYFVPAGQGQGLELRNVPVPTERASPPWDSVRAVLGHSHLLDYVMRRLGKVRLWYGDGIATGVDADLISCRLMARFAELVRREGAKALVVAFQQAGGWTNLSLGAAQRRRTSAALDCAAKAGLATLDTYEGFSAAGVGRDVDAFFVDWHFNVRGNALAAQLITTALAADKE